MQMGGAEKVVEVLHEMYPDAPIYTSAYDAGAMPDYYRTWDIRTSFIQRLVLKKYSHRMVLMLYPSAFESFDLSGYDLVISSSSAFAKGVITQPHTTHICYTHAPMRYAWATRSYMEKERVSSLSRTLLAPGLHYLRTWDAIAATRVDRYVANSSAIAKRIRKFYRREAEVVHPPVDTSRFQILPPQKDEEEYALVASRLVPYKRVDLAVLACTRLGKRLKVAGDGRQIKALKAVAGPTIEFLGYVPDSDMPALVAGAKMFLMPGEEDFGIAPVEANACGVPVVAFAAGGALDVQVEGKTGCLFREPSVDSLCEAIERAWSHDWDPEVIRQNAMRFDTPTFCDKMKLIVATTEQGERRQAFPDRRKKTRVETFEGDRRRIVMKNGRPVWFDQRRHILGKDGVTVVGEQIDTDASQEKLSPVQFPPGANSYDVTSDRVIQTVSAAKKEANAPKVTPEPPSQAAPEAKLDHQKNGTDGG
jgi:glycosyltransferase involved in cell wall biosynthesis